MVRSRRWQSIAATGYTPACSASGTLERPTGFDRWMFCRGRDSILIRRFSRRRTHRHQGLRNDIITDLSIEFLQTRPKNSRSFSCITTRRRIVRGTGREAPGHVTNKVIPTVTLRTITRRARMRCARTNSVFDDLTRRDLKLHPPADLKGTNRMQWLNTKPTEVEIRWAERRRAKGETNTTAEGAATRMARQSRKRKPSLVKNSTRKYQRYMQDTLPACSPWMTTSAVLDWLDANGLRENTVVIYTSDQGFFSATTASTTSDSCTNLR